MLHILSGAIQLLSALGYVTKSSKFSFRRAWHYRNMLWWVLVHPVWPPCTTFAECFWICNKLVIVIFPSCSFENRFALLRLWAVVISITLSNRERNLLRGFWKSRCNNFWEFLTAQPKLIFKVSVHMTRFVEHKRSLPGRDMITLESYKPLDITWRCRTKSSSSSPEPQSMVFIGSRSAWNIQITLCIPYIHTHILNSFDI